MVERNIELLERTMQHILDHPKQHRQKTWLDVGGDCGTAACFAGWACILDGRLDGSSGCMRDHIPDESGFASISSTARGLLGLTREESVTLFKPFNTRPMLERMVKDLVNGDSLRASKEYRKEAYPKVAHPAQRGRRTTTT